MKLVLLRGYWAHYVQRLAVGAIHNHIFTVLSEKSSGSA